MENKVELSDEKKIAGCVGVALAILVTLPLWFFILYKVLCGIHADEATWLAFWLYVPAHCAATALGRMFASAVSRAAGTSR